MKFCTFRHRGERASDARVGVVDGKRVFELKKRATFDEMLAGSSDETIKTTEGSHDLAEVILHPPVSRPGKIIAAIVNTRGMLGGDDVRLEKPRLDMKAPSTVIGPGEAIRAPKSGIRPEVELAAVVGAELSDATPAEAGRALFGYTILNDVTAPKESKEDAYEAYRRDLKTGEVRKVTMRGPLFRSKNHDTFCPLGPWVVTADEMAGRSLRKMTTKFEGFLVQSGSTDEYIFTPEQLCSYVSGFLTLEPGDIVSCGSVGWTPGALRGLDPTEYLLPSKEGLLELEIEGIGILQNPVVLD